MPHAPRHEPGVFHADNGRPPPLPSGSCEVSTDAMAAVEKRLYEMQGDINGMKSQVQELVRAITGHTPLGFVGIVQRLDKQEIEQKLLREAHEKNDRKLFRFGTILTLIGALALFLKEFLVNWITSPHKP